MTVGGIRQSLSTIAKYKIRKSWAEVQDFVTDYAKNNGYTYILGTSDQTKSVLYGDAKSDLTDVILEGLNASYKNNNSEEKKKEATEVE